MAGTSIMARWQGEITLVVATVLLLSLGGSAAQATVVNPYASPAVSEVRPEFISFGIDASQLTEKSSGQPFDFTRPALKNLASELAPAFIRYSGTKVESTFYDDTNLLPHNGAPASYEAPLAGGRFVMNRDEWVAALEFADRADLSVIAATSAGPGPRNIDGSWDPDNARALFERAITEGYPPPVVMFGNEPNLTVYGANHSGSYTAADYAEDVNDFLALKNELLPESTFVGPGPFLTTGSEKPLNGLPLGPDIKDIMAASGSKYDVVSYHQYPAFGDSEKCLSFKPRVPADTLSDQFLDVPKGPYEYMAGLRDQHAPGKPLWIDESGNTACGGVEGYSDKFISTFYYLNSLGYLAQQGVEVVTRWTLSGPQPYALIDDATLEPRADYWAAVLWRRLMGPIVLSPAVEAPDPKVRIYAQCLPGSTGGTTTLLLNTSRTDSKTVELSGKGIESAEQYLVTGDLDDDQVSLNGAPLSANPGGTLPAMPGVPVDGGAVSLPPASYVFVTMPAAEAEGCGSPAPPPEEVKSKVRLSAGKQSLRKILKSGRIRTSCRPDMASTCRVEATIPRAQAKRVGIPAGRKVTAVKVALGKRVFTGAGRKPVVLKLGKRVLRKLRKASPKFRPRVRLKASASGPGITIAGTDSVRLQLRR